MLSASLGANGGGGPMPLSPSAQATLSKHLPKLQAKRLMQHAATGAMATATITTTSCRPQTCDAGCLTGKLLLLLQLIGLAAVQPIVAYFFLNKQLLIKLLFALTDLCSSENLPEVEIFSLLEEQIPKYKIRNDFLTDFAGYANEDWFVPAPALPIPVEGLGLTKEQTRECLNYFRKSLISLSTIV